MRGAHVRTEASVVQKETTPTRVNVRLALVVKPVMTVSIYSQLFFLFCLDYLLQRSQIDVLAVLLQIKVYILKNVLWIA